MLIDATCVADVLLKSSESMRIMILRVTGYVLHKCYCILRDRMLLQDETKLGLIDPATSCLLDFLGVLGHLVEIAQ